MTENFKHLVRVANTDLDGNKPSIHALLKIKGVGPMFANAVCQVTGVDPQQKVGTIKDEEVAALSAAVENPAKHNIPSWLFNRRNDYETGEDKHLITGDLQFQKENDIKRLKKLKNYRGVRHAFRLPLRGQRTKSNFRRNKSKGKGGLGVKRKK
ncbi:MAG: 30S ribosomal protein S13 [Candidatus Nanoarchaeia archaeon]